MFFFVVRSLGRNNRATDQPVKVEGKFALILLFDINDVCFLVFYLSVLFLQDEQMEDMNELASRNTELEARVDTLLREKQTTEPEVVIAFLC